MTQKRHLILREYGNGVMDERGRFFPFKSTESTLSARQNIRYYLKELRVRGFNYIIHAGSTYASISAYQNGVSSNIVNVGASANAAAAPCFFYDKATPGILTDINTAVSNAGDMDITNFTTVYAEIDVTEGEYIG